MSSRGRTCFIIHIFNTEIHGIIIKCALLYCLYRGSGLKLICDTGIKHTLTYLLHIHIHLHIYKTHLLTLKHSLFPSSVLLLHVYTRHNPFAHPCSYYYVLSPSILFFAHLICFALFLFYCTFYSLFLLFYLCLYICAPELCDLFFILFFFALSTERTWLDLRFTSDCIIYYVTNKQTLNLDL